MFFWGEQKDGMVRCRMRVVVEVVVVVAAAGCSDNFGCSFYWWETAL